MEITEADIESARARGYLLGKEGAEKLAAVEVADLRRQLEAGQAENARLRDHHRIDLPPDTCAVFPTGRPCSCPVTGRPKLLWHHGEAGLDALDIACPRCGTAWLRIDVAFWSKLGAEARALLKEANGDA